MLSALGILYMVRRKRSWALGKMPFDDSNAKRGVVTRYTSRNLLPLRRSLERRYHFFFSSSIVQDPSTSWICAEKHSPSHSTSVIPPLRSVGTTATTAPIGMVTVARAPLGMAVMGWRTLKLPLTERWRGKHAAKLFS
jgi:hypothetical protein